MYRISGLATPTTTPALKNAAERWLESRVDVSGGTLQTYRVALGRLIPRLGDTPIGDVDAQTVAALVAELHASELRKQTIRKTVSVLAMILDYTGVQPNPARDKQTVRLPREERRHVEPPNAEHVEDVVRLLPTRYFSTPSLRTMRGASRRSSTRPGSATTAG